MSMVSIITGDEIEAMLREKLDITDVQAIDLKGGNHWQVDIVASDFEGLITLKRHRLVNSILAEPLATEAIHALVINAKSPSEV